MKKKILLSLVLSICLLTIFAGGALAAKKSRVPLSGLRVDGAQSPGKYVGPSPVLYELSMQPDCEDIHLTYPVVIMQHDQSGMTYYDYQKNGSMGRMIAVSAAGNRSMVFHETRGDYTTYPRFLTYNCKDALDTWCGPTWVDGGPLINAGYGQMLLLHDGRELAVYHTGDRDAVIRLGASGNPCTCWLPTYFDVPQLHETAMGSDPNGIWPKGCVVYDEGTGRDYIHLVTTEPNPTTGGAQTHGYQRCYLDGDNLVCCSPNDSCYTIPPNVYVNPDDKPIAVFDTTMCISPLIVSSPVSEKVAIVYTKNRDNYATQVNNDVVFIESTNNGDDWLDGNQWPPTRYNVTQYAPANPERAYTDVGACYDYNGYLHIVWTSCYYDSATGDINDDVNLMHWTYTSPLGFYNASMVAPGYWDDGTVAPGSWNRNISKMSISAIDPFYHPDSVYLFCTWSQFGQDDLSAGGWTNSDIYGAVSHDSGRTWTPGYNLTGTETDDCAPGECLSEHWSSLAENMYGGDLHIQYVCDRDAGGIVQDEGSWTNNPVMYMQVQQLPDTQACGVTYTLIDPPNFYDPPIKVLPGGLKALTLQLRGIYNIGSDYEVTCDHPDVEITAGASGWLAPGARRDVDITIFCPEEDKFIAAVIQITVCIGTDDEKTFEVRLHAVCNDDDYYECARDERTQIWKANEVCSLWVCCNTEQRVWDKRLEEDYQQVIFSSGVIVATTEGTDTVVGRQDYSDVLTGARDTIKIAEINDSFEPGCIVQKIYVKKTFICANKLEPPNHLKWWWISINKRIFMFRDDSPQMCPDWKKEQIIKHVWIEWGDVPGWWPDQSPFVDYEDIYFGIFADVDAPFDEDDCNGCNTAGYDATREIMWQHGWWNDTLPDGHPEFDDYYVALALTDTLGTVIAPYGVQNVLNQEYLYPQDGWGWKEGELYQLAATPGVNIHHPGSVDDRTMVLTAAKIDAGSDPEALDAEFVLIEAFIPTGLADLQQHIDDTRSILIPELYALGAFREYVCGDANGDGIVSVVDIVYLVNHLYAGGPAPDPYQAADANGDTRMDIADVVAIVNYLFLGYPIYCYGDRPCSDLGERDTLIIQGIWGSAGDTVDIPIFVFNDDSIFFNLSLVIPDPNKATFLDTVITEFTRLADIDVVQTLHDTTGIQIWFPDVGNEEYWNSIPPGSGIAAYLRCVLKEDIPLNSPMCIDTTFFPPGHSTGFYTPNTDCIIPEFECSTPTLFAPWDLEAWSDTLRTYLSWTNPQSYDSIRIYRGIDTLVLLDVLPGDDTSYSYTPDIGVYCYCLTVERDGIESNTSWPGCASYSPRPYEVPSVLSWSGSALAPPDTGEAQPEYFWRVKEESTLAKSPGWTYGPPTLEGGPAQCRTGLRPWVDDGWGTNRTEPYYEDDYCTNPLVSPAIRLPLWFPFGGVWLIVDHCYVTGDINDDDRLFVKIQDCDIPANQQYLTPVRGCEYAPGQGWNACDPVDGTPGFNGLPREWPNTSRCPSMYQIPEGPFNDRWVYIENYLGSDAVDDGPTPNGWFICRVRVIGTDVHRGDCNGDGMINIGDVIVLINYLFMNGDPPIPLPDGDSTGDANDDGDVNIADAVYLINFLFTGGSPPPPP